MTADQCDLGIVAHHRFAAVVLALAVAGCGEMRGGRLRGAELFTQSCAACHSLSGRQSAHRQGGDLLGLDIGRDAMFEFVREMPVRRQLDVAQERAVAAYVLGVESARRRRAG